MEQEEEEEWKRRESVGGCTDGRVVKDGRTATEWTSGSKAERGWGGKEGWGINSPSEGGH